MSLSLSFNHRLIQIVLLSSAAVLSSPVYSKCLIDGGVCSGCGCKGGPGYREIATGRCVGFKDLPQKCGSPPSASLCTFENTPGTGANRECALAPAPKIKTP